MSNSTNSIRVRLRHQNHPTGQRRRAGHIFGVQPTIVEVSDEELAAIKADPYLQILPGGAEASIEGDGSDDESGDEVIEIKLDRATKPQLVKILTEELKQIPGVDFEPEASNAILKQLITDLRTKNADTDNSDDDSDDEDDDQDDDSDDEGGDE